MSQSPIPERITIDFRRDVAPSHSWILGVDERRPERVELLAFEHAPDTPALRSRPVPAARRRAVARPRPTALMADCSCPEFCERDHANE